MVERRCAELCRGGFLPELSGCASKAFLRAVLKNIFMMMSDHFAELRVHLISELNRHRRLLLAYPCFLRCVINQLLYMKDSYDPAGVVKTPHHPEQYAKATTGIVYLQF